MATFTMLFLFMLQLIISCCKFQEAAASGGSAKPGCQERCGNLIIAYPFGIGRPGCYLDEAFRVECDGSTQVATLPYVSGTTIFNFSEDTITVMGIVIPMPHSSTSGKNLVGDISSGFLEPYFSFSYTMNKFMAVGCDIFAYLKDSVNGNVIIGCASLCESSTSFASQPDFSSCSGYGCCQTLFQKKLGNFSGAVLTMNTKHSAWASNQCSYIVIVEKSFTKLNEISFSGCKPHHGTPMVLDWSVGNLSCANTKKTICGHNTYCDNSTRDVGYLCRCSQGYQGNPYLPHGCQGN